MPGVGVHVFVRPVEKSRRGIAADRFQVDSISIARVPSVGDALAVWRPDTGPRALFGAEQSAGAALEIVDPDLGIRAVADGDHQALAVRRQLEIAVGQEGECERFDVAPPIVPHQLGAKQPSTRHVDHGAALGDRILADPALDKQSLERRHRPHGYCRVIEIKRRRRQDAIPHQKQWPAR